jgi:hypothetical protein
MSSNTNDYADEYDLYLHNLTPCIHCYNNICSSELIITQTQYPVNTNQNIIIERPELDINILAVKLPQDILVLIYNDYFRPHKFAQLFKALTTNSIFNVVEYKINLEQFIKHCSIFLYTPIKKYISKVDTEFLTVMNNLEGRGYTSVFKRINPMKISLFLEILMYKYH